jgi:hypothetical protein
MDIIGVKNPYGLIQKAGKRKTLRKNKKTYRRKNKKTRRYYK